MKKTPKTHGGARPGSGRKPAGPAKMKTRSIVLDPVASAALDERRGTETPGRFITRQMGLLEQ